MPRTGSRTPAGKAIVATNAIRHGVFAKVPVVPGLESESDWEAHRQGVLESLVPTTHLEYALAERAALLLWRVHRVARYEAECTRIDQEEIDEDRARAEAIAARLRAAASIYAPEPPNPHDADRARRYRLLADPDTIDHIIRYEAHLSRQLNSTLHELEALQARRRGEPTPLARLDVSVEK